MLAKNVKYLRKKNGYTFRTLASKCNISTRSIKAIEDRITTNPTIRIVDSLAKGFEVTIDDLIHKDLQD